MRRRALVSRRPLAVSPNQALIASAVLAALAVSVPAQLQFEELPRKGLPSATSTSNAIAIGDLDGDGDLDLVFGNQGDCFPYFCLNGQNQLYLNDGTGTFQDATITRLPVSSSPTNALAVGDVDGDGDLDLVSGNAGPSMHGENRLYLNDGSGTFSQASAVQLPIDQDRTVDLILVDLDNDGDLDLVTGNASQQQNRLYVNNGSGVFTDLTTTRLPTIGDTTLSLAAGDLNGDGHCDLVLANQLQNRIYLNDGTGSFADATLTNMPVDGQLTTTVAIGDVDSDGDLDIVFGNRRMGSNPDGQDRLYLNDGNGSFSDSTATHLPVYDDLTNTVTLGDLDGDGDLDLVVGNSGDCAPLGCYYHYQEQNDLAPVSRTRGLVRPDKSSCGASRQAGQARATHRSGES